MMNLAGASPRPENLEEEHAKFVPGQPDMWMFVLFETLLFTGYFSVYLVSRTQDREAFLGAPLIENFLMPGWLQSLPEESYDEVTKDIGRLINEERHEAEFAISFKATLVVGKKALLQ